MKRVWQGPGFALFVLVLGVYAYFYQAGGWNQNCRFDETRALVEDHALKIDRFAANTGDKALVDGHFFCDKAPGVSLVGVVPYGLIQPIFGSLTPTSDYLAWASWWVIVCAIALPSAIGVVAMASLLAAMGLRASARYALAAAWGLATLALPYSTLYYGHQLGAALLVAAFAILVRIRWGVDHPSPRRLAIAGMLGGAAVVVEYPAAIAVIVLLIYSARSLPTRQVGWILLGGIGPALVLAGYHAIAFGAPWHLSYDYSIAWRGIRTPNVHALRDLTITPFRGLFFSAPWLALALPGGERLWRAGARAEVAACSAIFILFLVMNASLVDWNGGSAIGPRFLVPSLPFLVVLVAGWFARPLPAPHPSAIVFGALLVLWSAVMMFASTAVRPEVDQSIAHPFGDYILRHLSRGEVATSTQSIDSALVPVGAPPSAWNLGEKLGLGGLYSLLPLAAWIVIWSWWLVGRVRASGNAEDVATNSAPPPRPGSS